MEVGGVCSVAVGDAFTVEVGGVDVVVGDAFMVEVGCIGVMVVVCRSMSE